MGEGNGEDAMLSSGALFLCHASRHDGTVRLRPRKQGEGEGKEGLKRPFPSATAFLGLAAGVNPPTCPASFVTGSRGSRDMVVGQELSVVLQGSRQSPHRGCWSLPALLLPPTEPCPGLPLTLLFLSLEENQKL